MITALRNNKIKKDETTNKTSYQILN